MSAAPTFLRRHFLPVGLLTVALVGLLLPGPGTAVGRLPIQYVAVAAIFICSGLMLRTEEVHAALSAWRATLFGSCSILFITPVIGATLAFHVPIDPSFQLGLALFCCMPTTLSSGIVLTAQARGNAALALLLTVATNTVGILTVPFVLAYLLGAIGKVDLSATELLVKLCLTILLPLSIGRFLRRFVATWVDAHRSTLTMVSNLALISIPWIKFSQSSDRLAQIDLASLAILFVAGLAIHGIFLILNDGASRALRLAPAARKAVVLMASQKTLPVAMTVVAVLPEDAIAGYAKGLIVIPCITFHLGQIIGDAVLASRWGSQDA
jgi:sodium/bile acid cotransporter 7